MMAENVTKFAFWTFMGSEEICQLLCIYIFGDGSIYLRVDKPTELLKVN